MNNILKSKWIKAVVFLICLLPLGVLIREAFTGNLSSNPTQFLSTLRAIGRCGSWPLPWP